MQTEGHSHSHGHSHGHSHSYKEPKKATGPTVFTTPQSIAETAPKAVEAKQAGANAKEAGDKAKAVNLEVQKIMSALKIKPNKADEAKVSGAEAQKAS